MARIKKEFGEGTLFSAANYISWFLIGNFYFLLLNIPLIVVLVLFLTNELSQLPQGFAFIFILCSIPVGPSITALLSTMGKLVRNKDIDITRDFFKAYKVSFWQALFFWTFELIILSILYIDAKFFISSTYPKALIGLVFIFMAAIFLISLHIFPLISRFYFNKMDILKISIYYTFRKFSNTTMNLAIILTASFIFFRITSVIVVCIFSIICYGIMFFEQKILLDIEDKFINKKDDSA
ncbi:YesL family protein [Clostridium omnivorum]|uniref:DUF624 domain-containing protein n=1 Tax=Clostridium omnivorum TaxID=1604902 RepID=A0ABQ5N794_9CLOT|nr:YesL family protein [Clostridium sp. E14]GLC31057.1 hypothetical protein bsdE14_24670 [Clostridium sp. E14]